MLRHVPHQLSIYSVLYDKIPNDHILKTIAAKVDYSILQIDSAIYADKLKKHGYISGFEPSCRFSSIIFIDRYCIYWYIIDDDFCRNLYR
ncbi:hypothetical protein SRRS_34110 [Sporomusa rhizae]